MYQNPDCQVAVRVFSIKSLSVQKLDEFLVSLSFPYSAFLQEMAGWWLAGDKAEGL